LRPDGRDVFYRCGFRHRRISCHSCFLRLFFAPTLWGQFLFGSASLTTGLMDCFSVSVGRV
jgi:hypothetical protein